MSARHKDHDREQFGLVPPHLDYGATPPFVYLTLSALTLLGTEGSVQQYIHANPDAHRATLELGREVAKAGIRVRDKLGNAAVIDEHLRHFTAEEIWMIDLAVDVLAMFATGGGLPDGTRGRVLDDLRSLDEHVKSAHWRREVHKAGDGPAVFRELRAHIPPHAQRSKLFGIG
jgi:hypothetical protein